jgi:hypothetical protein
VGYDGFLAVNVTIISSRLVKSTNVSEQQVLSPSSKMEATKCHIPGDSGYPMSEILDVCEISDICEILDVCDISDISVRYEISVTRQMYS